MTLLYPPSRNDAIPRLTSDAQTIAAGGVISLTDRPVTRLTLTGTGSITMEAGSVDGLFKILVCDATSGTVSLAAAATIQLASTWTPVVGDSLQIYWDGVLGKWVELGRYGADYLNQVVLSGVAAGQLIVRNATNTAWINQPVTSLFFNTTTSRLSIGAGASPTASLHVRSTGTAVTDYTAEFQSSTTTNAGRTRWSQGSTYALALGTTSTGTTSATAPFQWITRSTGAVSSTPLILNFNGTTTQTNTVMGTSSSTNAGANFVISATTVRHATWIAAFTGVTRDLQVGNIAAGMTVEIYLRNTGASATTINITAGVATTYTAVNCSNNGAASRTSISLAATSGTALVKLYNVGGVIVGGIY